MSGQGISPATSVVANGTFERFLSRMQLDVAQQVPLLSEGSSTLVTVERPLACEHMEGQRILVENHLKYFLYLLTFRVIIHFVHKLYLSCIVMSTALLDCSHLCGYACAPSARWGRCRSSRTPHTGASHWAAG